jgi:tRNA modification GTPase
MSRAERQTVTTGPLETDTIAAVATPPGRGAIAMVRLSGQAAIPICDSVFRGRQSLPDAPNRTAVVGEVLAQDGAALDQVVALVMRSPETPTGEDVVEITCHGGLLVPRLVLQRVVAAGARPAEPGEFTKRAFLNGKLDLTQAEAVEEIVRAGSERALRVAVRHLKGGLSRELEALERDLVGWMARIEAGIDFAEDDLGPLDCRGFAEALAGTALRLDGLLAAHVRGDHLKQGLDVVIVGKPNAGKSSLFNRLVGSERVIVSEVPGTTRDVVDGRVGVDGVVVKLHDTAGVASPRDGIEAEAVRRTRQAVDAADIVLVVLDSSTGLEPADHGILGGLAPKAAVVVVNKTDLAAGIPVGSWADVAVVGGLAGMAGCAPAAIGVSALTGAGLPELRERLAGLARERAGDLDADLIANERHAAALREALVAVRRAEAGLADRIPLEFLASDVRLTLDCLGDITGKRATAQVLDEIFSRFCIGK